MLRTRRVVPTRKLNIPTKYLTLYNPNTSSVCMDLRHKAGHQVGWNLYITAYTCQFSSNKNYGNSVWHNAGDQVRGGGGGGGVFKSGEDTGVFLAHPSDTL